MEVLRYEPHTLRITKHFEHRADKYRRDNERYQTSSRKRLPWPSHSKAPDERDDRHQTYRGNKFVVAERHAGSRESRQHSVPPGICPPHEQGEQCESERYTERKAE